MQVFEAKISRTSYAADFGRMEAQVTLLVKDGPGTLPHRIHIRTSQPLKGKLPLERRLIDDAVGLARALRAGRGREDAPRAA